MQFASFEQLTSASGSIILEQRPDRIKTAFINRAAEMEYPVEARSPDVFSCSTSARNPDSSS
ncbi:MAG: hypothetical protein MUF49_24545 [Oculatellaceae cyanobacterium Prado106]|jgi:hypothetical protein|nr:hypothetical protein [Oculatellaceae cyanobacterium Prado106]